MLPLFLYKRFCELFPWFKPHTKGYKACKEGGIDIYMDPVPLGNDESAIEPGGVYHFELNKKGWVLSRK